MYFFYVRINANWVFGKAKAVVLGELDSFPYNVLSLNFQLKNLNR